MSQQAVLDVVPRLLQETSLISDPQSPNPNSQSRTSDSPIPTTAITGSYLAPFTLANAFLSLSVVRARISTETFLESSSRDATAKVKISDGSNAVDPLLLATRVHGNFLENVPFALAVAAVVELNGGNRKALTYALGGLLLARISHVVGLTAGVPAARAGGYFGSLGVLSGLGVYGAYLSRAYWGF